MEISDIEKKLADFESKLKPIPKGETTIKADAETLATAATPPPAVGAGEPCFNKCFIDLMKAVKPEFFGSEVSDIVYMFLDQFPACAEGVAS